MFEFICEPQVMCYLVQIDGFSAYKLARGVGRESNLRR